MITLAIFNVIFAAILYVYFFRAISNHTCKLAVIACTDLDCMDRPFYGCAVFDWPWFVGALATTTATARRSSIKP